MTLVSKIQNTTGFKTIHQIYGDLVLNVAQLEFISIREGYDMKEKYLAPVEEYGAPEIIEMLEALTDSYTTLDVGGFISKLRNEISHVGRPKNLLNSLPIHEIAFIDACLDMVTISYVLRQLGISKEITRKYQRRFKPRGNKGI